MPCTPIFVTGNTLCINAADQGQIESNLGMEKWSLSQATSYLLVINSVVKCEMRDTLQFAMDMR